MHIRSDKSRRMFAAALVAMLPVASCIAPVIAQVVATAPLAPDTRETADAERSLFTAPTRKDNIGRIIAPVTINGAGPFRFVVDTGATHSAISEDLAKRLNLPTSLTRTVLLSGVTGSATVGTVEVARFETGELVFEGRHMPLINSMLSGTDGVLGAEGLETKRIIVDFVRNRLQITESRGKYVRQGYVTVPIEFGFNLLLLAEARIGTVRAKAIIDTGSERTLGNNALRDALGVQSGYFYNPSETGVQGVTAHVQNGYFATAPRILIGGMKLNHVGVTFGDLHVFDVWGFKEVPALLIGMDVLGVLDSMVIDYGRKQIQLRPRGALSETGSRLIKQ